MPPIFLHAINDSHVKLPNRLTLSANTILLLTVKFKRKTLFCRGLSDTVREKSPQDTAVELQLELSHFSAVSPAYSLFCWEILMAQAIVDPGAIATVRCTAETL